VRRQRILRSYPHPSRWPLR